MELTQYHPCKVRWQQREGFLLWVDRPEPERESLWADEQNRVPLFPTKPQLNSFVLGLEMSLEPQEPTEINLDRVAAWLAATTQEPVKECLSAWSLFDDLGVGVKDVFSGNLKTPARNQVFDLLYTGFGPYLDSDDNLPWRLDGFRWQEQDVETLRAILKQGFSLWQKHVYWK